MGHFRRVAHRRLAAELALATGERWRSQGWRDTARFVEGRLEGRTVGVSVWSYALSGGSDATLYVPLARDPGAFEARSGRWEGPESDVVAASRSGESDHSVAADDPRLRALLLDPETLTWLREGRGYFQLKVRPPGRRTKPWGEDQTPLPFVHQPVLSFYALRADAPAEEYVAAFRRLLALARRIEAP